MAWRVEGQSRGSSAIVVVVVFAITVGLKEHRHDRRNRIALPSAGSNGIEKASDKTICHGMSCCGDSYNHSQQRALLMAQVLHGAVRPSVGNGAAGFSIRQRRPVLSCPSTPGSSCRRGPGEALGLSVVGSGQVRPGPARF